MDLLIRADAGQVAGTGHVMRSLALAQAWRKAGGKATFVAAVLPTALDDLLRSHGFAIARIEAQTGDIEDVLQTADHARKIGAECVVVDGYRFGPDYQRALKENGLRLMVVDDNAHLDMYKADIILNQNIFADEEMYTAKASGAGLLLGPRYALLRDEFTQWTGWERTIAPSARNLLITMGGSDAENVTLKVVRALNKTGLSELPTRVVVGPANRHRADILRESQGTEILTEVESMSELMAWADIAISASGTTCWELAFMGLPSLLLVLADNQSSTAEGLNRAGVAKNLGRGSLISEDKITVSLMDLVGSSARRREMSEAGRQLVDGQGASRVVDALIELSSERSGGVSPLNPAGELTLRSLVYEDWENLLAWRNDPVTVAGSINNMTVGLDEHKTWLREKIDSPSCIMFIGQVYGRPVGQVRFDIADGVAKVSVVTAPGVRGRGYGTELLKQACLKADQSRYVAFIRPENRASIRAFSKAGFFEAGPEVVDGISVLRMERRNSSIKVEEDRLHAPVDG